MCLDPSEKLSALYLGSLSSSFSGLYLLVAPTGESPRNDHAAKQRDEGKIRKWRHFRRWRRPAGFKISRFFGNFRYRTVKLNGSRQRSLVVQLLLFTSKDTHALWETASTSRCTCVACVCFALANNTSECQSVIPSFLPVSLAGLFSTNRIFVTLY